MSRNTFTFQTALRDYLEIGKPVSCVATGQRIEIREGDVYINDKLIEVDEFADKFAEEQFETVNQ